MKSFKFNKWFSPAAVLLVCILGLAGVEANEYWFAPDANNERPLAIIRRLKPDVLVKHKAGEEWIQATMAERLFDADTVRTGAEGFAVIQFMDNSIVKVKENSLLILNGETPGKDNAAARIAVEVGDVFLNVSKRQSRFEVQTTSAVAAVMGTSFSTKVNENGETTITGFSGQVQVTSLSTGETEIMVRGKRFIIKKDEPIEKQDVKDEDLEKEEQENENMDKPPVPKILKLQFRNANGTTREVIIEYFDN